MKLRLRHAVLPAVLAISAVSMVTIISRTVGETAEVSVPQGREKVTSQVYDFGDSAVELPGMKKPVELRGVVHRPVDAAGRKMPLVVFLHGLQATCYSGSADTAPEWPCPAGLRPVASFRGYDYLAADLASHGFVVASISANGITPTDDDFADSGMLNRAHLIERHLQKFATWNTTGGAPFDNDLVGAIDPAQVGLMGHSRGGGGVARFMTIKQTTGLQVRAVLGLAPAPREHPVVSGAALAVVLATCDGDTTQHQGVDLVDGSRYATPNDPFPKYTVAMAGGNHNFFNTVWSPSAHWLGGVDDTRYAPEGSVCRAGAPGRLTEEQQRQHAITYVNSFFRYHLAGDKALASMWTGATTPTGSAVQVARHPGARDRLVINRLDAPRHLSRNALGGTVARSGLTEVRICSNKTPLTEGGAACLTNSRTVPTTSSPHHSWGDLPLTKVSWNRPNGSLTNTIPARNSDFSGYEAIQLRAVLDFSDQRNPVRVDGAITMTVTDRAGHRRKVDVRSPALAFPRMMTEPPPPGVEDLAPHLLLNQVRVPLSAFSGVDLSSVRSVDLGFPAASGSLALSDLMLSR